MNRAHLVVSAVAAAIAASAQAMAGSADTPPAPAQAASPAPAVEMCYGINASGRNDCATAAHSCAGEAQTANDPKSWIYVPAGTCTKIAGGSLKPKG